MLLRSLILKNSNQQFFKLSVQSDSYINMDCVSESLCKSFAGGPSYGNYQPAV